MKVFLFLLAFLSLAAPASAANAPSPVLDAVVTEVAAKSVSVYCETDENEWKRMVEAAFPGFDASRVLGYTYLSTPVVYLSPRTCLPLVAALGSSVESAGYSEFGLAILTLVHEAVHQRGVLDEGVTECTSLPLLEALTIKYFKVAANITKSIKVIQYKILKFENYRFRVRSTGMKNVSVSNPVLDKVQEWAQYWHRAKPASYQGGC